MNKLAGKKIVFLFTPGPIGGAEKIVLFGVKALRDAGIDVSLWVIKEERVPHVADAFIDLLNRNGIIAKIFSSHQIFDNKLLKQLSKSFEESAPDFIHAHGFKAAFYGKLSAPKRSHLVITHHGKTSHTLKVKVYEFIEDQIMKRAAAVIAVSQDMKKGLVKAGIAANKISVVENFMTSSIIPKTPNEKETIQLLFVGRLSPEKGCSVLIEAMKHLEKERFHLTVLGDGVERENLHKRVMDLGLTKSITFTGFKQNVNEYMAASDVIVMPSFREGQPLTLIEACCMGIPVVGSNVGGIPELVIENKNGYLFRAGDSLEMSQVLNKLLLNIKTLQKTAEDSKSDYVDRFSGKTWAKRTITVYERLLSH
jgi:glycosyltransferase involved in cell wall biosynthesis